MEGTGKEWEDEARNTRPGQENSLCGGLRRGVTANSDLPLRA
jgi:hypothetical protein